MALSLKFYLFIECQRRSSMDCVTTCPDCHLKLKRTERSASGRSGVLTFDPKLDLLLLG